MKKTFILLTIVLAFPLFIAASASADYSFNLTVANQPYAVPDYATVNVGWVDSTHAAITITRLSPYYLVNGNIFALNVAGTFALDTSQGGGDGIAYGGPSPSIARDTTGSNQVDGFGDFNLRLNAGPASYHNEWITVYLTGSWANDQAILLNDATHRPVAAHLWAPFAVDAAGNQTFYATSVPIPAAAWLLGSGLIGLVAVRRRFKK